MRRVVAVIVLVYATLLSSHLALAQLSQQGPKLVGTGGYQSNQGTSVSLSADGNTAIVGGPSDNGYVGAAWVWTRSGGVWTQQGSKLVGSDIANLPPPNTVNQGRSVSLSADGNTAIVGGPNDYFNAGAAWVWTRSGGVWTQQGSKLVATLSSASQGSSVALSADGNTAIVGGPSDSNAGAAWVWTRSGGVWTQQGTKLVGSGAVGAAGQGTSVALSADGNTAIVGGHLDNSNTGAAWVWTRSGGVWTQQGSKLVGSGAAGPYAYQGSSVSLSADGNTAIVGGYFDNSLIVSGQIYSIGAAWVWTRSGGVWTQQGSKLVGSGAVGTNVQQGSSVSLSADGNTAIVGGYLDNSNAGAAWVWTRSGGVWTQQGTKLVGSGVGGVYAKQGTSVSLSADGNTAIVGGPSDNYPAGAAWVFAAADLTITKSHTGNFRQGDTGDTYTITVANSGSAATSGTAIVTDTLPTGLTPTAPNRTVGGWSCSINGQTLTCTRSDVLASGGSYPAITLTVNVANNAAAIVTNTATVSGGGESTTANDTASDLTTIDAAFIPAPPTGVTAAAVSSTRVDVTWTAVAGAASYQIDRKAAGVGFLQIGTSLTSSFSDTTASADSAYLYRVRAVNGAGVSSSSAADLATTVIFVDDPLVAGSTVIQAVHITDLRTAVNAVRSLAGLAAATFTDPTITAGLVINLVHVSELRTNLDAARTALGLPALSYTDGTITAGSTPIKAVHFTELRNGVN